MRPYCCHIPSNLVKRTLGSIIFCSNRWSQATYTIDCSSIQSTIDSFTIFTNQQSMQLLYETCLCISQLSFYEPAVEYLATSKCLPRLMDVVKSSTKEKVVRVIVPTFKNLLPRATFGAQMVDLGMPQVVRNLKTHAWGDEDLIEALNQLEEWLKDNIKKLSSFDKYKQEVLLVHLDWSPVHKDSFCWRENINSFEENDFQAISPFFWQQSYV